MISFSLLIYSMFLFLIFFKVRVEQNDREDVYFQRFNCLRGAFALEIVIGHVIRHEQTMLYPLGKFMIISVAFFFFVSGWGLCRSYHQKEHYLDKFLVRKCPYLIVLSLLAFAVRIIVLLVTRNYDTNQNIVMYYFKSTNWYIWELLVFYILFYLVYRFVLSYRCVIIALVTFGLMTAVFFFGFPQGYYSSSLAFPAGLFFYEYYPAITGFFKKIQGKITVFIMAVLGLSCLLLDSDSLIGMVYLRNVMCLALICIMAYFLTYFCVDNAFLRFLGKHSTEIYLYQFVYLNIVSMQNISRRILLVCTLTLVTAILMHPIHSRIRKNFFK